MNPVSPIEEEGVRSALRRLSLRAPQAGPPPAGMLARARRRVAITAVLAVLALSATAFGGLAVSRTLMREARTPWPPAGIPVTCSFHRIEIRPQPKGYLSVNGVDGTSPTDVWISGSVRQANDPPAGLFWHWDGSAFTMVPSAPGDGTIFAVQALSPSDAWAAGPRAAQRWDGRSWKNAWAVDAADIADIAVYGISGASDRDVWAVGSAFALSPSGNRVTTWHFDGRRWTEHPLPIGTGDVRSLWGVSTLGPDDAWAVGGDPLQSAPGRPLVLHWDGRSWTRLRVPVPTVANWYGTAVSASAKDDVWLTASVGDPNGDADDIPSVVERWDGSTWTQVPTALLHGRIPHLESIMANGPGDVWAAGSWYDPGSKRSFPLVEHFDGRRWSVVPTVGGAPDAVSTRLNSIGTAGGQVWTVGYSTVGEPNPQGIHQIRPFAEVCR